MQQAAECPQTLLGGRPLADKPAEVEQRPTSESIARVEVYERVVDAWPAWTELEELAPASAYQTRKWLVPWIETVGRWSGVCPMFAVAYAPDGAPVAFFPFGIVQQGVIRVVNFLGGRDSNSNLGLIRPRVKLDRSDVASLLRASAGKTRPKPDVFVLVNQPSEWDGIANPLAQLRHQRSPSDSFSASLGGNGAKFVDERLSADARRKLRKKHKKLSQLGAVSHIVASNPAEVERIVDTFFAQKLQRFRRKRISSPFESPHMRRFLLRAGLDGLASGSAGLELHALAAGERIVAVYAGTTHRRRFYAMLNSFDPDPEIARTSPGDLLLMSMMQMMCGRGCRVFDLGIGEARYKSSWCDLAEPLFDTAYGVTPKGRAYAWGYLAQLKLKACVRRNQWLWPIVQKWRYRIGERHDESSADLPSSSG